MSEIDPISHANPQALGRPQAIASPTTDTSSKAVPVSSDSVELSAEARMLSQLGPTKLSKLSPVRQDLVDRVSGQIADGTYVTPEKIHEVVNRLATELGG